MAAKFSHLFVVLLLALLIRVISTTPERNNNNGKPATPRRRYYLPRFGRAIDSSIPKPLTIRRCDCDETDECFEQAYKEVAQCKASCQDQLIYFGANTEQYLSCFEENVMEANVIGECLEENSHEYCSLNGTNHEIELELLRAVDDLSINGSSSSINGTDNSTSQAAAEATTPEPIENADKVFNLIKKANLISLYFVRFESCVVNCLKNHINECLKEKSCWIKIPKYTNMEDVIFICTKFEALAQYQSQKACHCLAHNQKVTKLIPVCPFIGFTF